MHNFYPGQLEFFKIVEFQTTFFAKELVRKMGQAGSISVTTLLGIPEHVEGQVLNYQLQQVPYLASLLVVLADLPTLVNAQCNTAVGVSVK